MVVSLVFGCGTTPESESVRIRLQSIDAFDYGNSATAKDIFTVLRLSDEAHLTVTYAIVDPGETLPENLLELSGEEVTVENCTTCTYQLRDAIPEVDGKRLLAILTDRNRGQILDTLSTLITLENAQVQDLMLATESLLRYHPYGLELVQAEQKLPDQTIDIAIAGNTLYILTSQGILKQMGPDLTELVQSSELTTPLSLTIGPQGHLFIIDELEIKEYSDNGDLIQTHGFDFQPGSITWDDRSFLYVTERVESGSIRIFDRSLQEVHRFRFTHPSIVPKSIIYNPIDRQIYINRTSINGTGIVRLDPTTYSWLLMGSLELLGTFADDMAFNGANQLILLRTEGPQGHDLVTVGEHASGLEILHTSKPLNGIPVSLLNAPAK